jgi:hypothetical protein
MAPAKTSLTDAADNSDVSACRFASVVLVLLLAAGCGYGDDDEESPRQQAQPVPELPQPRPGKGTLPVGEFNDFVAEERPAFATSTLRTAIEFAHAGDGDAATTSVVAFQGAEGNANEASVVVTRDGLADDSVRALRYQIVLERAADGTWRLRSARSLQRCQPNRGHQEFSTKLCR